ncbi:MAG: hypothetical protein HZA36_01325 [Parcubacteria group bacterium]|nr:hypothetical protein [Parcubacteria group bacterium]
MIFFLCLFFWYDTYALGPVRVSDTVSDSRPGISINHTLQFTPSSTIPVNGKILIILQPGAFTIPSGMDRSDVDVLIDGIEKLLSATPGVGTDIVVTMSSGTSGVITMVPKSGPINAGSVVTVEIGTNATYIDLGAYQIQSPSTTGSYAVDIETKDASNVRLGVASAMVAILEGVSMTGFIGAPPPPPPTPAPMPAPSGGGGGSPYVDGELTLCGKGYPGQKVTILKDAQVSATVIAQNDEEFEFTEKNLQGTYAFGIYTTDMFGHKSYTTTITERVESGTRHRISCIFLSPTLEEDKLEVLGGDSIVFSGQTASFAEVLLTISGRFVGGEDVLVKRVKANKDGLYTFSLITTNFYKGDTYDVVARAVKDNSVSKSSTVLSFRVGETNLKKETQGAMCGAGRGDFNCDQRVNLIDFSILAYWYKRPLTDVAKQKYDLNSDGKVDLRDFSILAFYWTG